MALVLADRVRDTTTTTGTGTITLSGTAPTGYQNFSVVGNGNTTYYTINAASQWEVGIGTYSSTGPTLSRDTVLASSNAGSLVNFSSGTKDVFVTYPAEESVYQDGAVIKAGSAILAVPNGGTGAATLTGYVKGSGTSALTASATIPTSDLSGTISLTTQVSGTLPVGNGGTGATSFTANGVLYGNGASAVAATAAGTTGQVLVGNTGGAPSWATLTGIGVTSFSAGTTGFTPSTGTTGAITLAGTLNVANGGTGTTSLTSGYLLKGNGTSAASASVVYDDGTNVGIGTSSPDQKLVVNGAIRINGDIVGASGNAGAMGIYGGASYTNGAGIVLYGSSHATSPNVLTFNNGSYTERMRIASSGNVGIGTSSPASLLHLGTANPEIRFDDTDASGVVQMRQSGGAFLITVDAGGVDPSSNFQVAIDGTERMRIDSSGNVGIGTSSPSQKLQVQGTGYATSDFRAPIFYDSANTSYYLDPASESVLNTVTFLGELNFSAAGQTYVDHTGTITFRNQSGFATSATLTTSGNFTATGNVTAYSDIRVKDNVKQIEGALDKVQAIRGVTYNRTDLEDTERRYGGVIAQEIEKVLPEAIFENDDRKAVDYNATIGLLIEAIKELRAEVAELKGK